MRVLVTGGAGFVGVHVVERLLRSKRCSSVTVVDRCSPTAAPQAIPHSNRVRFVRGDILDLGVLTELVAGCDAVIHLAAETFVDASIADDRAFVETNIAATAALLRAIRQSGGRRLVHVSTDEVFGHALAGAFTESSPYRPRNPYAATKAAADHLVRAYGITHGIEETICHFGNLYGRWQYPEKLIPVTVSRLLRGEPARVYGDGRHSRTWLHVTDAAAALVALLEDGRAGESYLVAGDDERTSLEIVTMIAALMGVERRPRFVADRPGHDLRYVVDTGKVRAAVGWAPAMGFEPGMRDTVRWMTANQGWWQR